MGKKTVAFLGDTSFDSFQSNMLAGAMKAADENDVNLLRFVIEHYINKNRYPRTLDLMSQMIKKMQPDGLMFLGWSGEIAENPKRFLSLFKDIGPIPMLSIGKVIETVPSIFMNGGFHIREILNHLCDVHHYKNIAFIQPIIPDERYQVYEDFMKEKGLYKRELVLTNSDIDRDIDWFFIKRVKKMASILFDERKIKPDAIMSMYTYEAANILVELQRRKIKVPEEVALTSWEDGERGRYSYPSITSVYYPFYEQGYEGCNTIAKMIRGEAAPLLIPVKGEFRIRRSCGCSRGRIDHAGLMIPEPLKIDADKSDIDAAVKEIESIDPGFTYIDRDSLVKSLISDLRNGTDADFTNEIENYLFTHDLSIDRIYKIQEDLLNFRSKIIQAIQNSKRLLMLSDNIFLKLQIVFEEHIEAVTGNNDINRRDNVHTMQEVGQDIVITLDIDKIINVIEDSLKKVSIPNCYMYLFRTGRPSGGEQLILSYVNGKTDHANKAGNERHSLHDHIFGSRRHVYTVYILHIKKELLGFIFFEPGPADERLYYSLSVELSSAIYGALVLKNLKKTNSKLKSAQKEIVKNMEVIEESNIKLSKLDELKNNFIANITHDFRSPLMIILNTADLGLHYDNAGDFLDITKRYNSIYNASLKLKMSIDRLLDLAKMDAQGVKLKVKNLMLRSYIANITDFYISATASTNIDLSCRLPSHEIPDFYTDEEKLEEILNNIITNALKFVDPDSGMITISLEDLESEVEITVSDNGIGIPPDKINLIFGRFEQIEGPGRGRFKGTGIGLSFVKELTGYLKGSIRAESEGPGLGSKFILTLKKGKEVFNEKDFIDEDTESAGYSVRRNDLLRIIESDILERSGKDDINLTFTDLNKDNEFDPVKGIILIVDDNYFIREIVKEYLSKAGYRNFITAADGVTGIEAIYMYRPDLIITDYNMPRMRGDELHDQLISNPDFKRTPILFLTGISDKNLILERKKKGAMAYLSKPVDEKELLVTVDIHMKKYLDYKFLIQQASMDELTGLANKHSILKFFGDRIMLRSYRNTSIIFMDIDFFKEFNDHYGHPAGDVLLAEIGAIIKDSLRKYDKAGRYGGEEFLIILPEATLGEAVIVAEKLRNKIRNKFINYHGRKLSVTASFGVSSLVQNSEYICRALNIDNLKDIFEVKDIKNTDWEKIDRIKEQVREQLIEMADKALYRAKYTVCRNCNYYSEKPEFFKQNTCPECGGKDIIIGRDKVAPFQSLNAEVL